MTKKAGKLFFLFVIVSGCVLSGCMKLESKIFQSYISPEAQSYKIDSVVLLPLKNDDTTNTGTFYSTNYFLKQLKEKFPNNKFDVLDISKALQTDSTVVDKMVESINRNHTADLDKINSTKIGDSLNIKKPDAIILGRINNPSTDFHVWIEPGFYIKCRWSTGCNFTYYMVSLKDGRVLWMSNIMGVADYEEDARFSSESDWELYPPLDMAISNGIDKIIDTIPLKKDVSVNHLSY